MSVKSAYNPKRSDAQSGPVPMTSPLAVMRTCLGYTIPIKPLALFFDTLAVQLNCGRPISESLIASAHNSSDPELQQIMAVVAPRLRQGHSLSHSLRPFASRFPEIVTCVMEVGEVAGGLADSSQRLADTFKQTIKAERDLSFNAYNPRLVLLAVCLIQIIVSIVGALSSDQQDEPIPTLALSIALQVASLAAEIVVSFYLLRALMRGLYRWRSLRLVVDTIKLALPGIGIISRNLSAARWARSFAVLWGAGVNISTALEISAGSALNAHYERELRMAAVQTRLGRSLSECLARTQLLPPYLLKVIRTCEITGRMDDQLLRIAADMERDALNKAIIEMNRFVIAAQILLIIVAVIRVLSTLTTG